MTEIEHYQPPTTATSNGYDLIRATAQAMADANTIANAIARTEMVPKHFRGKPDDLTAAILYGATLGFDPMQSARQVYVVHGQAGLYARSMAALVMSAGHRVWTVESTDEAVTVAAQRRGAEHVEESTWTIDRAKRAGYVPTIDPDTGKYRVNQYGKLIGNEKYLTTPQEMLYAKALSEVARKIAPDVLNGVYAVEELQAEQWTAEQVDHRPTGGLAAALNAAPEPSPAPDAPGPTASAEPDPASEPGRASAGEADTITSAQQRKMGALMREAGLADRPSALAYVADVIGREVGSRNDLTKAEAGSVIDALEVDVARQALMEGPE